MATKKTTVKKTTQKQMNIYEKLFHLQQEIGSISKDAKNPFYKSKYFDINSLIGQLKPLLAKHNLLLMQPINDNKVYSVIHDLDGSSVTSSMELPVGLDAQKMGSAVTYFRRYTLQSLLGLQAVDDDGNLASTTRPQKPALTKSNPKFQGILEWVQKGGRVDKLLDRYTIEPELYSSLKKMEENKTNQINQSNANL
tara:strand:+ start:19 stop:606 length:588 start_codon:yes stop_codon:yes gene_type:complete